MRGPDSERIRELEDLRLRCRYCGGSISPDMEWRGSAYLSERVIIGFECDNYECGAEWELDGTVRHSGVTVPRAAGLLPGPDDIVVSREALAHVAGVAARSDHCYCELCLTVYDALHPAQEQQT